LFGLNRITTMDSSDRMESEGYQRNLDLAPTASVDKVDLNNKVWFYLVCLSKLFDNVWGLFPMTSAHI